jgi:AAA+ ATPase superfamily predicted ATPase
VDREDELAALEGWWAGPNARLGIIWGRRRAGKSSLLQTFSQAKRTVFYVGTGRPVQEELRELSRVAVSVAGSGIRDLESRPFSDWEDAFETLASLSETDPLLLVLDEFPEMVGVTPQLPERLRAFWERVRQRTRLRILLCGSAIRTMEAIQEQRAPLYGRFDLSLQVHPLGPHAASQLLPNLSASTRALVWGLLGGIPLYLEWWDQGTTVENNLARLACTPGGQLLNEGQFLLAAEEGTPELGKQVLYAIAAGINQYNDIQNAIKADPRRPLDRLVQLRMIDRSIPVTESTSGATRRTRYRIADNLLSFWLRILEKYRSEIERGLGRSILPVLMKDLDDHMGLIWEETFRTHLRWLASGDQLGADIVAVGPFWLTRGGEQVEIDAVALAGRNRRPVLVGEAKWARRVDGRRLRRELESKAKALPGEIRDVAYWICAREEVANAEGIHRVTAEDIFP